MSLNCDICGKPYSSFEQYEPHDCFSKRELKERAEKAEAALRWNHNMEDAPKDGTEVLVKRGNGFNCLAHQWPNDARWFANDGYQVTDPIAFMLIPENNA